MRINVKEKHHTVPHFFTLSLSTFTSTI